MVHPVLDALKVLTYGRPPGPAAIDAVAEIVVEQTLRVTAGFRTEAG